jgi:hypothetical protein
MTAPIARDFMYRRRRFEAEIIELCVRWYITYRLSYRDLVAMMAERGVAVSHTTILRWVIRYVPEFEKRWDRWARRVNSCGPQKFDPQVLKRSAAARVSKCHSKFCDNRRVCCSPSRSVRPAPPRARETQQ